MTDLNFKFVKHQTFASMEEVIRALELKNQLDALRPLDKEQEDRIMQKFRLDWNYHSNNLEGNSLTYGETKALIMFGVTAQGKPLKDHFEITGHNEAINWVIDMVKGERPLTENFIRELHELLLKESYEKDAQTPEGRPTKKRIGVGQYKSSPNHVLTKTGEMFYFATPEETPAEMAALMSWYNEKIEEADVNPILLAAEFHYKFIRIHPFDDGNGRTARILMNFILMKYGYPPVIIKTDDKENYFAVLRLADTGNIEAFIDYIAKNLNRSLEIMMAGANGESIEEPDDIDKEIALLEKRLEGFGEKSQYNKNIYSVDFLLQNVILKLRDVIIQKSGRLTNMYIDNIFQLSIDVGDRPFTIEPYTYDELFAKSEILLEYDSLIFNILFKGFVVTGFNGFDYQIYLRFRLYETYYEIYDINEILLYQKPYGVEMRQEELERLAISEVKRHKDFIEQKIAEKENEK